MRRGLFIVHSLICFFFVSGLKAGNNPPIDTTVKHDVTNYYTESMLVPFNIWQQKSYSVDTTLNNSEIYTTHYSLGNTGLPYVPVMFNTNPQPLGFYYGEDYLSEYFKNDTTVRYYHTRAPYLSFFYVTDPEIHQFLDLVLTQNFAKNFNVAIGFKRIRSQGEFLNQSTNLNQLTLTTHYHTSHYMVLFDGLYNIYKDDQNGGVRGDSNFINPNYESDRTTIPVNLANARTIQIQTSLRLQQFYFFGFNSTDTNKEKPLFYVSNTNKMLWHSNIYTDPTLIDDSAGFYPNVYGNNVNTYDSLQYTQFTTGFNIGTASGWNGPFKWEFGIEEQYVHFSDYIQNVVYRTTTDTVGIYSYHDTALNNIMVHARIYNTWLNGHILFDAYWANIVSGSQQGDMQASARLGFRIDSLRMLKLSGAYSHQTPAFIYDLYDGNDLSWMNHFNKVTATDASVTYADAKWHLNLGAEVTNVQNMTYFNSASLAAQTDTMVTVFKAFIEKNFTLCRVVHLNTREIYQQATANSPVHIPTWITENSLYYENYLFKHHMLFKIGVDVFWNPKYYVYAYQPETDQYYVQSQVKLGNYVYFDPFISFRIKTFRMFFKMENVTSDLIQNNGFYGYALHYPMPDRVLRFGINWDFWN